MPVTHKRADDPAQPEDISTVRSGKPRSRKPRIRCPKCAWRPRASSRWWCHCGFSWNTFDTAGLCPGCGFQWEITACLACHQWSKHLDWYAPRDEERPE